MKNLTESTDLSALNINPPTGMVKALIRPKNTPYMAVDAGLARVEPGKLSYIYELADHLGNVRASIKKEDDGSLGLISQADYYPFGMLMPGRTTGSNEYRFGYQGQFAEKDEETGYNQFEARLYDSRLGRWLVVDPIRKLKVSPFVSMSNDPINRVDPDGRDDYRLVVGKYYLLAKTDDKFHRIIKRDANHKLSTYYRTEDRLDEGVEDNIVNRYKKMFARFQVVSSLQSTKNKKVLKDMKYRASELRFRDALDILIVSTNDVYDNMAITEEILIL